MLGSEVVANDHENDIENRVHVLVLLLEDNDIAECKNEHDADYGCCVVATLKEIAEYD